LAASDPRAALKMKEAEEIKALLTAALSFPEQSLAKSYKVKVVEVAAKFHESCITFNIRLQSSLTFTTVRLI